MKCKNCISLTTQHKILKHELNILYAEISDSTSRLCERNGWLAVDIYHFEVSISIPFIVMIAIVMT